MLNEYIEKLQNNETIIFNIKVVTNKSKTSIIEISENNIIRIGLKATPIQGKANQELTKFLSKIFKVKKDCINIISGKTSKLKKIKIII